MAREKSVDKRSSTMMGRGQPQSPVDSEIGINMMATATGLRGGEAKKRFQSLVEEVFSLMLNPKVGYICIKKNKAGKITKIQRH